MWITCCVIAHIFKYDFVNNSPKPRIVCRCTHITSTTAFTVIVRVIYTCCSVSWMSVIKCNCILNHVLIQNIIIKIRLDILLSLSSSRQNLYVLLFLMTFVLFGLYQISNFTTPYSTWDLRLFVLISSWQCNMMMSWMIYFLTLRFYFYYCSAS